MPAEPRPAERPEPAWGAPGDSGPAAATGPEDRTPTPAGHLPSRPGANRDPAVGTGYVPPGSRSGTDHDSAVDAEPDRTATFGTLHAVALGAAAAICAVVVVVLGVTIPPAPDGVATDRLGPDTGEPIAEYLARAGDSLAGDGDRWALVSFTGYLSPADLAERAAGVRVSRALYQVPLDRVATPLVAVQVPDSPVALARSGADAAWQLTDRRRYAAAGTRGAQVLDVSIARLHAGCACSPGLVVRASPAQLRELAGRPGIRAVQALPADAVAERFGVAPLLPDSADPVLPRPDDGPVPPG